MPEPADEPTVELVLGQARTFATRELDAARSEALGRPSPELLASAGRAGLFGLTIPTCHGGLGLPLGAACRVVTELAVRDRAFATTVGLHAGLGVRGLVELAEPHLANQWLPALATGEQVAAFCATEPTAGSDLGAVRTTAVEEGDELRLDGEKSYVTNGAIAGVFTVLARTPGLGGARARSLLCVPRDLPGVEIGPEEKKLGIRGSSTTTVRFDGVRLPRDHVLGAPGGGLEHAHHLLVWGRTIMAAGCLGTARAALEATTSHVTTRRQFARPVGEFEAARAHVARIATSVRAMDALIEYVGRTYGAGEDPAIASAAAKVFCSEAAFDACDRAVQLHGALGFLEDTGVPRLLRDCRITRIFEGANDVLLLRIGTALAGGADATLEEIEPPRVSAETAEYWALTRDRLRAALELARHRHGVAIVRRQVLLQRIARAYTCLLAGGLVLAEAAGGDAPLDDEADLTTLGLTRRAARELDAIDHLDRDTALEHAVTERLYDRERPTSPPGGDAPTAEASR